MICPKCQEKLTNVSHQVYPEDFVHRVGFSCGACRWRGWVGVCIEEAEDKKYGDVHIQLGLNRLYELSNGPQRRHLDGARLSDLLNVLDRLAGEL